MPSSQHFRRWFIAPFTALFTALLWLPISASQSNSLAESTSAIRFAEEDLRQWESKVYAGNTHYEIVEQDGHAVLFAQSESSAAAILKQMDVDLTETPFINWRWRVENTFGAQIDEQSKAGDDYPARLYLIASDGFLPWQVIAVNYVWASNQAVDSHWPNAWSDKSQMLAVQSGDDKLNQWQAEKRNVRDDFQKLFGRDTQSIKAVAIMADSDNSGASASSYFGDIYFTAE